MNQMNFFIDSIKTGSIENFDKYYDDNFLEEKYESLLPIHYACRYNHIGIVEILIQKGCNIEACGTEKRRPIHIASRWGCVEVVKILISKQCDVEACEENDWRPIHFACNYGHVEVSQLLIDYGCSIEVFDNHNWRPIHFACASNRPEIAQLLIEHKCDTQALTKLNLSPLDVAKQNNHKLLIEIINAEYLNPKMSNEHKFIYACKEGNFDVANFLLKRISNIDLIDNTGKRAIDWACENGFIDIVTLLIKNQCNIEQSHKFHISPVNIAIAAKNDNLINILQTEIVYRKLIGRIASSMNIMCNISCDHKLCSASLQSQTFVKGDLLGKGGFGSVYRCYSSQTLCEFALKIIPIKTIDAIKIKNHINDNLINIKHSRIVQYFGAVDNDKKLIIFMEFISGGTLHERISKNAISENDIIHITQQVLEGLLFLHDHNIIHRDIKPSNILLNSGNNIKLVDFDLSRLLIKNDGSTINARTLVGTIYFSAPEIFKGQSYKYPADIYSLGITILTMITRNLNYHDSELPQIVMDKNNDLNRTHIPALDEVSKELKSFIEKLLNPDPLDRPSAAILLRDRIFLK